MKVAVNIVTYNSADDIVACIDSVQAQTFRDFRIHILDNDSTDETIHRIAGTIWIWSARRQQWLC